MSSKPLKEKYIYLIVLLGIAGLLSSYYYMLGDLKQQSNHLAHYKVVSRQIHSVDTINVVYKKKSDFSKLPKQGSFKVIDYSKWLFQYNSVFLAWLVIVGIMMACSMALVPVLIFDIGDIYRTFRLKIWPSIFLGILVLFAGVITLRMDTNPYMMNAFEVMEKFEILLSHPTSIGYFVGFALFVALIALFGQLLVNKAISSLPDDILVLDEKEQEDTARKFLVLKDKLKFFLLCDAVLIVFSVVATDTLRRSIMVEMSANREIFPQNFVYLYGLMFTFYLALFYMPIFFRLKFKGRSMMNKIILNEDDDKKYKYLSKIFLMEETALDNLKATLSILAPVLSSLLPNILKL